MNKVYLLAGAAVFALTTTNALATDITLDTATIEAKAHFVDKIALDPGDDLDFGLITSYAKDGSIDIDNGTGEVSLSGGAQVVLGTQKRGSFRIDSETNDVAAALARGEISINMPSGKVHLFNGQTYCGYINNLNSAVYTNATSTASAVSQQIVYTGGVLYFKDDGNYTYDASDVVGKSCTADITATLILTPDE